jgi:undecaprenyl-diphosphatase
MDVLNNTVFLWLNASAHPTPWIVDLAVVLADWAIWLIPLTLCAGWLYGNENSRRTMLMAAVAGGLGLFANQIIGTMWMHPRPFMVGLGHTLITHAPDSSFPSDHLTLWWAVAFSLLASSRLRRLGGVLAVSGIPVAWSRIYLGVHFPLDMAGAAAVAAICTWGVQFEARWYLTPLYNLALTLHQRLFRGLIKRGWVAP